MKLKVMAAAAVLAAAALSGTGGASAAPHHPVTNAHVIVGKHHKCTRTSSGTCIRGGEFCPQADYGRSGWDAKGRRYVCKGNHQHPHWEKP